MRFKKILMMSAGLAVVYLAGLSLYEGFTGQDRFIRSANLIREAKADRNPSSLLKNVDLDMRSAKGNGRTLLMYFARLGEKEAVELLLRYGANPDARDNYGRSAEDEARTFGHTEIADLIKGGTS
jgi:ankyrin repeat protein